MQLVCHPDAVTAFAPAKLNLFLEVLGKRPDGFHELETVMAAIDWCDTLRLTRRADSELALTTGWAFGQAAGELGDVPSGAENIVIRALAALRAEAGITAGANVELIKRIPSAAGLGGASSDAAAALLAANQLWRLHWPREKLAVVAAEIGSDVPFFLGSPAAVCLGRGEIIEPLPPLPRLCVVVARPPVGLSTPAVYRECVPATIPRSSAPLIAAWKRGDFAGIGCHLANRLEPAAARLTPWISRLREAFASSGCYGEQMSGSGSACFGLFRHAREARRVVARLRGGGLGFLFMTHTMVEDTKFAGGERAA